MKNQIFETSMHFSFWERLKWAFSNKVWVEVRNEEGTSDIEVIKDGKGLRILVTHESSLIYSLERRFRIELMETHDEELNAFLRDKEVTCTRTPVGLLAHGKGKSLHIKFEKVSW